MTPKSLFLIALAIASFAGSAFGEPLRVRKLDLEMVTISEMSRSEREKS